MAEYVTYGELNLSPDFRGFKLLADHYGVEPDGREMMTCFETDKHFEALLSILKLKKEELPVYNVKFIKKEYLQCFDGEILSDEPAHWYDDFDDPAIDEYTYFKALSVIVFNDCATGDEKAGCWGNWLGGESAMHGDFHCMFFAKDAKEHFKYSEYPHGTIYVDYALQFANEKPDAVRVIFGFG
ncbi:hypothetical protein VCHA53O466_140190 [Vibrio chagasii]|nr:hypothetical protein VCHA53O466_140190 [Vibrio chagasii]